VKRTGVVCPQCKERVAVMENMMSEISLHSSTTLYLRPLRHQLILDRLLTTSSRQGGAIQCRSVRARSWNDFTILVRDDEFDSVTRCARLSRLESETVNRLERPGGCRMHAESCGLPPFVRPPRLHHAEGAARQRDIRWWCIRVALVVCPDMPALVTAVILDIGILGGAFAALC
jgi:hypothetical protein